MTAASKKFDHGVQLLQAFAISLVVLGHMNSPLTQFIFSFHMPLFFFMSGFFINIERSPKSVISSNVRRLLIPYVLFGLVGLVVTLLKSLLLDRLTINIEESLIGLFYWMDASHLQHYGFVLWFLPALFWGRLLVFMLLRYVSNPVIVLFITIAIFLAADALHMTLPFGLDKGMVGSAWVASGYLFYRYSDLLKVWWLPVALSSLAVVFLLGGPYRLDIASMQIGNPWVTIPYTISVAIVSFQICKILADRVNLFQSTLISLIASNTMLIFIAHTYTNNAADLIVEPFLENGWYLKFAFTLAMIWVLLTIKSKYPNHFFFRYL